MSGYKEFEGKSLDEAIRDACLFYDTTRERLEVEILNDAKGGIFGLVGARKARIRARRVELVASVLEGLTAASEASDRRGRKPRKEFSPVVEKMPEKSAAYTPEAPAEKNHPSTAVSDADTDALEENGNVTMHGTKPFRQHGRNDCSRKERARDSRKTPQSKQQDVPCAAEEGNQNAPRERCAKDARNRNGRGRKGALPREKSIQTENGDMADMESENLRRMPIEDFDAVELEATVREVIEKLTLPILGEAAIAVTLASDRVRVSITDVETPGLLIGRDGQTLASLQYLATRMVSARMKAMLRIQIDAGDYRERQDERLRELAFSLAEKVKSGGRPQVTRPLSSYHRRVIHLALQEDPLIQTHSKGEGEMKRVMITRRKTEKPAQAGAEKTD